MQGAVFELTGTPLFSGRSISTILDEGLVRTAGLAGRRVLVGGGRVSKLAVRRAISRVASTNVPEVRLLTPRAVQLRERCSLDTVIAECDLPIRGWSKRMYLSHAGCDSLRTPVAASVTDATIRLSISAARANRWSVPIIFGAEIEAIRAHIDAQDLEIQRFRDGVAERIQMLADTLFALFEANPAALRSSQQADDAFAAELRRAAQIMSDKVR